MHIYVLSLFCADVMMITRDHFVMTFSRLLKVYIYIHQTYTFNIYFYIKCSTAIHIYIHLAYICNTCNYNSDLNPCEPNPCQNGGVCIRNSKIEFICKCKHGYHGDLCDVNSVPTLKPNSSNEYNVTVHEDATNTESKNEYCYIEHTDLVSC